MSGALVGGPFVGGALVGGALVGAAAGALIEDGYDHAKDTVLGALGLQEPSHDGIETALLLAVVQRIEQAVAQYKRMVDLNETIQLQQPANGVVVSYQVAMRGRKHLSVFSPAAFILNVSYGPIGAVKFNMSAGWNPLDPPESSLLTIDPTDTHALLTVMVRYGEDSLDIAGA